MARISALAGAALLLCCLAGANAVTTTYFANGSGANTTATFNLTLALDPNVTQATVNVTLSNVSNYFMSHFHLGNSTTAGPVVLWIDPISPALLPVPQQYKSVQGSLLWSYVFSVGNLTGPLAGNWSGFAAAVASGNIYYNVHTKEFPNGLIRNQLAPAPPVAEVFSANLTSAKQQPPNNSTATATSALVFSSDLRTGTVSLTLSNVINFFMAHIHMGNSTTSGPVVLWLQPLAANLLSNPPQYVSIGSSAVTLSFNASNLVGPLSGAQNLTTMQTMARTGRLYANVHTREYPNGIIRSQYASNLVV